MKCQHKLDLKGGVFTIRDATPEDVAELDAKLERVAPGELAWLPPGVKPMRGLGDVVERLARPVAKVLGLEGCGGCKKRQETLNKLVPFGGKDTSSDASPPPSTK